MGLYDQYRSESNAPYAAAAAGQQGKSYQRSDLFPIPELRASPFMGLNPAMMAGAETPFPTDMGAMRSFNAANSPAQVAAPVKPQDTVPPAPPEQKQSPSRILAAAIMGMLAGASKYPIQQAIAGNKPLFNLKDQLAYGAVGALGGGAAEMARTKLLQHFRDEEQ